MAIANPFIQFLKFMWIIFLLMFFISLRAESSALHQETRIQAIIFDLGGVVVEANQDEAIRFISLTFDLSAKEAKEVFMRFKTYWVEGGNEKEFWENYALENEKKLSSDWLQQWQAVLLHAIKPIPGTMEVIQQLQKQDFRVALLSNARKDQSDYIRELGYYDLFKPALISCEIGYDKPDPRAFQVLLRELGLPPQVCLFIDDKKENVEAAQALGIDSIQFSNPSQLIEELAKRNIQVVRGENSENKEEIASLSPHKFKQIYSLSEIEKELNQADKETLVIFDVDDVLITTVDRFIHPECDHIFLNLVRKELDKFKNPEDKEAFEKRLSLSMIKPERVLVEIATPDLIKNLQSKGIKILALTSCPTGKFGVVDHVEKWRIDHLKSLGIDFSFSFHSLSSHWLTEIAKKDLPAPLFEKGILFSKGYSKGEVLKAFLAYAEWKPSKVIFIDDLVENHESLAHALNDLGIDFVGFHYLGASLPKEQVDAKLIEFQFHYLMKHGVWLSDQEVKLLDEL